MNKIEFIKLKNENRQLRQEYNRLIELSEKQFSIASKRKKAIKHQLKNTYILKEKRMLENELSEIYDNFQDTVWQANCIDVKIRNNGITMLSMKGDEWTS